MKRYISLKEQENFEKMRQYFIDRTNKHIDLVKKYSNKILNSDFNSFINVSDFIDEGDTTAILEFDTGQDGWALIYIFLSFDTIPTEETDYTPLSIISFGIGE